MVDLLLIQASIHDDTGHLGIDRETTKTEVVYNKVKHVHQQSSEYSVDDGTDCQPWARQA
jgi:hypothetical protein